MDVIASAMVPAAEPAIARPFSFPLYATPSRETGDSMIRGSNGDVMEDYFLFTSSMYVVSSFKSSNGTSLNSQNTTWYGYEEAVFNNKGRGFQGFKAIHTEMHAPDDDLGSIETNPRTRSTTIFRQNFPYAGLIQCQYTVRASEGYVPATSCPTPLSLNQFPHDNGINPISLTVNTWDLRDASDGVAGEVCAAGRSNDQGPVYLPFADSSFSESRKLNSPGSLVSSTATTTSLDNCGNVIEQTQDRTDHGFYTLSTTTTTYYNYDASNWWLNKTDRSTTSKSIVYAAGDLGHEMPSTDNLNGFAREGVNRTTRQRFVWHNTHRQPSCILQYEGSSIIACTSIPPTGTWTRQNIVYDTYGNTSTVTQKASNEPINSSRMTVTLFGSDGYFPTTITNALGQSTNTVFDQATGNPTKITDANQLLTKFEYDAFGREIERYFPDNNNVGVDAPAQQYAPRTSTRYQWISSCASGTRCYTVKTITDGAPIVTATRDRLNRVIQTTRGGFDEDISSGTLYNGRGQVIEQYEPRYGTSPSNIGTTFSYDALGRLIHKAQDRDGGLIGQLHTHYQHSGLHTRVRLTSGNVPPSFGDPCANNTNGQLLCVDRYIGSQGQTLTTKDADGESTMFWYDANGNPVLIEDAEANLTAANYNAFSQRTALWDPNMGGTERSADMTFVYNGYGELKTQTDAKGQSISFTYDKLGRMKRRNAPNIEDLWDYDHPDAIGQLEYIRRNQNGQTVYERDFSYDGFARATGHTTSINNTSSGQAQTFEVQIQPDGYFGRPVSMIYPTAFAAQALPLQTYHLYNKDGYLTREGLGRWLVDTPPGQSVPYYRKINNMSPRDQLVNVSYGNDAVDTWSYGPANGQMSTMVSSVPGGSQLANLAYAYDDFGNLKLLTNHLITTEEQFNYDQLHRLTSRLIAPIAEITPIEPPLNGPSGPSAPVPPDPQPSPFIIPEGVDYSYDAMGNILTKSDYGDSYEYDHVKHQICANSGLNSLAEHPGPHAVTQVTAQVKAPSGGTMPFDYRMAYDANGNLICSEDGNLTVQYDAFNLPTNIQRGSITQTFHYGPDLQRYRQDSSGAETLYIDKLYERKGNSERFYVGGYLVIERDSAGIDKQSFTHKDRLGSTVAITDAAGDIRVQQGFGPFGKARNENWTASNSLPGNSYDSRGFTGHEHLENTRLIHMNGRAYDFNLGRFLSIDPIIQFPENSQSLNPYSYLMNNPMAGTDPTGYMSCSVDNPSGCAELAEGLEDGGTIDVEQSVTGSRVRTVKVGEISNNGGNVSVSDGNGNQVASTSGTTNTGSGPSGGGQQGIAGLGGPGQAGNQSSSSPRAQGDGVACGVPLQCAGNSTTSQPTANASSVAAGGTERGFLDRAAEFGGNVLDGAVTGFRFAVFDFKEPLGGNFLFEGATLIPIFKAGKLLKFFRGGSAVTRGVKVDPETVLAGGRSGSRVKNLVGPPNSAVRGGGQRAFVTNDKGEVILDITRDRVKPVTPGQGFGPKRAPTQEDPDILQKVLGDGP